MNERPSQSDEPNPKQASSGEPDLTTPRGDSTAAGSAPEGAAKPLPPAPSGRIPTWDEVVHSSEKPASQPVKTLPPSPVSPRKPKTTFDPAAFAAASLSLSASKRVGRDLSLAPAMLEVEATVDDAEKRQLPNPDEALRTGQVTLELKLGSRLLPILAVVAFLITLAYGATSGWDAFDRMRGNQVRGPWPRLLLFYFAGGLMFSFGKYFQWRAGSQRGYGRLLAIGGLAALYSATYAAHFMAGLQVVHSAPLAGALLLACVASILMEARHQRSEALAAFGIALGYLSSVRVESVDFAFGANFVLAIFSVNLLLRNGWTWVAFMSLVASCVTFGRAHAPSGEVNHLFNLLLLLAYWCTFTSAVFWATPTQLGTRPRAVFLTLNNIGFLFLAYTNMAPGNGMFWAISLALGFVLLAIARVTRTRFASEPLVHQSYLIQGFAAILLSAVVGLQENPALAPALAVFSTVLVFLALKQGNLLMLGSSLVAASFGALFGIVKIHADPSSSLVVGGATGAILIFNAWWFRRAQGNLIEPRINLHRAWFSASGLLVWLYATWAGCPRQIAGPALALEGAVCILSCYQLRVREITLFGQANLACGIAMTFASLFGNHSAGLPVWNPPTLMAISAGVCYWWNRQKTLAIAREAKAAFEGLAALGFVAVSGAWISLLTTGEQWLFLSAIAGIGVSLAGAATRAWLLAAAGQLLMLESVRQFIRQLGSNDQLAPPQFYFSLATPILLAATAIVLRAWLRHDLPAKARFVTPIHRASWIYGALGVLLSLVWLVDYVPIRERIWVFALLGTLTFFWGGSRQIFEVLLASAAYFSAALLLFGHVPRDAVYYWPNLVALLVLGALQQIAKRSTPNYQIQLGWHRLMVLATGCGIWYWVSAWISERWSGFYITIGWAGVALVSFVGGLFGAERMYRLLGLLVLVCSLVRAGFDVVHLDDFYKFISLFALSVVLGVLSYIYTRFQKLFLDDEWLAEMLTEQRQLHKRRRRKRGL